MTPEQSDAQNRYLKLVEKANELTEEIGKLSTEDRAEVRRTLKARSLKLARQKLTALLEQVEALLEEMASASSGPIQITLSRSYNIAQFFAFKFVHQPRLELSKLQELPFHGSGIYAFYYIGKSFEPYLPISGTETPIYVGKASPKDSYAESTLEQGTVLFDRLVEHAKNMERAELKLSDFHYRCATVQSGLQDTVEGFMIKLFRPLWNKEVKVAYGIGKHGDAAETRANKRSPWDTLHPGRAWASLTAQDQVAKEKIIEKIVDHLQKHKPFADLNELRRELAISRLGQN
ncbi:restriction endonuclease [Verrucomicrobia bacterium LW23]|nr:restriction endonuclease [Verrucomicrobia bacterium LW23]